MTKITLKGATDTEVLAEVYRRGLVDWKDASIEVEARPHYDIACPVCNNFHFDVVPAKAPKKCAACGINFEIDFLEPGE